ncbi:unnamed protein product [Sphenostylis stenocarpa]|uniref:Uncharacterized protein n=1 Tax=Sphenostylis stenocarpa TaxID=92480 RepID=A0AA86VWG7_9FABA|nr:unnamed protein product [Sphenostylis stenocarpa]
MHGSFTTFPLGLQFVKWPDPESSATTKALPFQAQRRKINAVFISTEDWYGSECLMSRDWNGFCLTPRVVFSFAEKNRRILNSCSTQYTPLNANYFSNYAPQSSQAKATVFGSLRHMPPLFSYLLSPSLPSFTQLVLLS